MKNSPRFLRVTSLVAPFHRHSRSAVAIAVACIISAASLPAQIPNFIEHQGDLSGTGATFTGTGQFKFSIVNPTAPGTAYWRNDNNFATITNTGAPISEPGTSVPLEVKSGSYAIYLGSNNTKPIPYAVFSHGALYIRAWFSPTGAAGSFVVQPDVPIPSSAYAMAIADGSVTNAKIASGAVGNSKLGTGAVTAAKIASNTITGDRLAPATLTASNFNTAAAPGAGKVLGFDGSNLAWTDGPSNVFQLNGTSAYYNSGNVGIGTITPGAALELFSNDTSRYLLKLKGPGGNGMVEVNSNRPNIIFRDQIPSTSNPPSSIIGGWAGGLRFYSDSFWSGGNGLAMMAMDNAGHLGIGTQTPTSALHVNGAADALRLTAAKPFITLDDNGTYSRIQSNGFGMDFRTYANVINNHAGGIHLDGTGSVGIGTTTPVHELSIRSFAGVPTWTSNGWIGAIDLDNASAIAWASNSAGNRFGMGHTNGSFVMWRTAANPGTTGSPAVYDFCIDDVGNLGVGTTGPAAKLQVVSGGGIGTPQGLLTQTTSGDYARLRLSATGSPSAWDIAAGSSGGVMNFYATSTGRNVMSLNPNGTASVQVLSITGGADLAEPFPMQDETIEKGAVVVIDEKNSGQLKRSTRAYDRRVAGVVSGANGIKPGISLHQEGALEGGQNVALTGRVYVQADASSEPIEPGDLLTTSDRPGYAMKVTDHARAQGAVIGKAMSSLSEGQGNVLVLVTLQ